VLPDAKPTVFNALIVGYIQIVHESVYDDMLQRLVKAFSRVMERMGDPLDRTLTFCWIQHTMIIMVSGVPWNIGV